MNNLVTLAVVSAGTSGVSDSIGKALQAVGNDVTSAVAVIAPIGLGIFGLFFAWKKGIGFFKSISK